MGSTARPQIDPAQMWEELVRSGTPKDEATRRVNMARTWQGLVADGTAPEEATRQVQAGADRAAVMRDSANLPGRRAEMDRNAAIGMARGAAANPAQRVLPTISERRERARAAGQPFRLGGPQDTGEDTVIPEQSLLAREERARNAPPNFFRGFAEGGKDLLGIMAGIGIQNPDVRPTPEGRRALAEELTARRTEAAASAETKPAEGFIRGSVPFIAAMAAPEAALPTMAGRGLLPVAARVARTGGVMGLTGGGLTAAEGGSLDEVGRSAMLNAVLGAGLHGAGEGLAAGARRFRRPRAPVDARRQSPEAAPVRPGDEVPVAPAEAPGLALPDAQGRPIPGTEITPEQAAAAGAPKPFVERRRTVFPEQEPVFNPLFNRRRAPAEAPPPEAPPSSERGAVSPAVMRGLAGSGAGAVIGGAAPADSPQERLRNAITGAALLGVASAGVPGFRKGKLILGRGAANPRLTAAEREVLSRVGESAPRSVLTSPVGEVASDLYTRIVRRTHSLERSGAQLGRGRLPTHKNPGDQAMLASGSAVRAEEMLAGEGPFRMTAEGNIERTGTPAYRAILQSVAKERGGVAALNAYELSMRSLEVGARDIRTGISPEAAARVVEEASPVVQRAHEQAVQFRKDVRDYWAAEGGVSPEAVAAMDALGENYVPLNRVFDEPVSTGVGRPGAVRQQVRRLIGSERRILNPVASTVDQTTRMIAAADRNRVARTLVEAAEANPEAAAGMIERVAASPKALTVYAQRLKAEAATRGVTLADEVAAEIATSLSPRELVGQGNHITIWRGGTLETWRVAPELARSLNSLGPYQANLFVRLAGLGARTLKAGITLDPVFGVFNAIRDTFDATLQSRHGFRPGMDSVKGFVHVLRDSKLYHEWRAGGGGFSNTIRGRSLSTKAALRTVLPNGKTVTSRLLHPFEALADFARPFEEATRVGEYARARKAGESVARATRASQEITTNFQQIGLDMQGYASMTAFLNPAMQSLDRAFRVAGGEAFGAARARGASRLAASGEASKAAGRLLALGVGAISIPSLFFWLAAQGDQEIQDLRKTQAGLIYWFVRAPNGSIVHLPKPFLWGQIFGTGMEAALDNIVMDDPEAGERLATGIWDQISSNVVPTAAQAVIAQYANKRPFFGTPIVPPEQLGTVEPQYQGTERTGPAAQAVTRGISQLGEQVGSETLRRSVSPARTEELARNLTGRLGGYALTAADAAIGGGQSGERPTAQAPDVPVVGRLFARTPTTGVEPVQTFYENHRRATEAAGTVAKLLREGNEAEAGRYQEAHPEALQARDYESVSQVIARLRAQQRQIQADPRLDGAEKHLQLDAVTRQIIELTRDFNAAMKTP